MKIMKVKPTHVLAWIPCSSVWQLDTHDSWFSEEPHRHEHWDFSRLPRNASPAQLAEFVAGQLGYPVMLCHRWLSRESLYYVSAAGGQS